MRWALLTVKSPSSMFFKREHLFQFLQVHTSVEVGLNLPSTSTIYEEVRSNITAGSTAKTRYPYLLENVEEVIGSSKWLFYA